MLELHASSAEESLLVLSEVQWIPYAGGHILPQHIFHCSSHMSMSRSPKDRWARKACYHRRKAERKEEFSEEPHPSGEDAAIYMRLTCMNLRRRREAVRGPK